MIHAQETVPGWDECIPRLPDKVLIKAVKRPDMLRTAKQIRPGCITLLREHYDDHQTYDGASYATKLDRAKKYFDSFLDGTFYDQYKTYVDIIGLWNEIWAQSQTAAEKADRVEQERAFIEVFNRDHRGRLPAHVRLQLSSAAVGNSQPIEMYRLSRDTGHYLGYHPYTWWGDIDGDGDYERAANDWPDLSGLCFEDERRYGVKAFYCLDEGGPFESAVTGWKAPECLGNDIGRYVTAIRELILDIAETPAYQEGRVIGPVALFTTGRTDPVWKTFWTEQPELNALADMVKLAWKPGTVGTPPNPVTIPVLPISQRDPRWASVPMGENKTLGSWGCLLVSYNAVARFWELCPDDPPAFMQRMRDAGAMSGPYVLAGALATTFPGRVKYVGYEGRNPALRQNIINHMAAGKPVFARVDFNTATTIFDQHWIVLVGYTADDYLMIDPWPYPSDSQPVTVSSRYNIPGPDNNILEAIYYELLPDVPGQTLEAALIAKSLELQTISLNESAALQSAIVRDERQPVGSEGRLSHLGISYALQPAESLGVSGRWVYYCVVGQWGNVQVIEG